MSRRLFSFPLSSVSCRPCSSDLLLFVDALLASVLRRWLDVSPHHPHASPELRCWLFFSETSLPLSSVVLLLQLRSPPPSLLSSTGGCVQSPLPLMLWLTVLAVKASKPPSALCSLRRCSCEQRYIHLFLFLLEF